MDHLGCTSGALSSKVVDLVCSLQTVDASSLWPDKKIDWAKLEQERLEVSCSGVFVKFCISNQVCPGAVAFAAVSASSYMHY